MLDRLPRAAGVELLSERQLEEGEGLVSVSRILEQARVHASVCGQTVAKGRSMTKRKENKHSELRARDRLRAKRTREPLLLPSRKDLELDLEDDDNDDDLDGEWGRVSIMCLESES